MRLMRIAIKFLSLMVLALLAIFASLARGHAIGHPKSLEESAQEAEIIFKGTVVSSRAVDHDAFDSVVGLMTQDTEFKIASVIKGEVTGNTLIFRHYSIDPEHGGEFSGRQYYHFEPGKTYIIFAKRTETAGVFQQAWTRATLNNAGVLLASKDKRVTASTIKDIYWSELMSMLKSNDDSDVTHAIVQLGEMSSNPGGWEGVQCVREFDRKDVLRSIHGLLINPDSKIAKAALSVIGSHNPYMSEEDWKIRFWLEVVSGQSPRGRLELWSYDQDENIGGKLYWKDLIEVANSKSNDETRALAILALGLTREPALKRPLEKWLTDAAPDVRASGTVLLADFPELATHQRLNVLAGDVAPEVRTAAAREIGFAQQSALSDILAELITDYDSKVRDMALMSLVSLSSKNEAIATAFRNDPRRTLDGLTNAIEQDPTVRCGSLGMTAWVILFRYLQTQPVDQISSGKFGRYLDAMEKVDCTPLELRYVYAFYVQRGMTERAKKFRSEANKKWGDKAARLYHQPLESYFKQVDESPSLYKRE
jgi:hypothetical protein